MDLRRWDLLRLAALALGLAFVLLVAAYAFAAIEAPPSAGGVVAALGAIAIAGTGLLYPFRLGTGGAVD
jgi:hypothetical protein